VKDWVVGMGIETPLGMILFGTNTRRIDSAPPAPFIGTKKVTFTLPNLHLGRGQYQIHASFGVVGDESLVRIPHAATLESQDGLANIGTVSINASFSEE
jgi:ABC-2 type transport system ATP-binding protein